VTDLELTAKNMLSPYRYEHSMNVAECAKELARLYGANEDDAVAAAVLHDIMKDKSGEEQLEQLKKSAVTLTAEDLNSPKVWHAHAGAAFVRDELGVGSTDIYNAVRYHTTGRAGMSLLEKVIYVADYISADRTYNGVSHMRSLAQKSLEDAMLFALEFSITQLAAQNRVIHPDSLACYNELIIARGKNGGTQ
jgi:nicotinate-nucleotide adenylyltransferase